jgi:regulator of sirC expression with transglutaminase-like and TPR domain
MSEEFLPARQRARQEFATLIADDDFDLARAALLIACEEYPEMDLNQSLVRLDELAAQVQALLTDQSTASQIDRTMTTLHALNTVLFEHEHFRANRTNYYDPQNSYFNRVLERRLGVPLTLSLLYIEIGKRLGLNIVGIGMPFHFLVRLDIADEMLFIDPFEKGTFLTLTQCRERLKQIFKHEDVLAEHFLDPVSPRQILVRMLTNLKHIYLQKKDYRRALLACDRILLLNPALPVERRDRGIVYFHLKYYARALKDLSAYAESQPDADDIADVQQQIKIIRQLLALMN